LRKAHIKEGRKIMQINTEKAIEALIRESERLQAVRDYVNSSSYIEKEVLKALLKDGEN
jgi:hypothetical protein